MTTESPTAELELLGQTEYALYSAMIDALRSGLDVNRILLESREYVAAIPKAEGGAA